MQYSVGGLTSLQCFFREGVPRPDITSRTGFMVFEMYRYIAADGMFQHMHGGAADLGTDSVSRYHGNIIPVGGRAACLRLTVQNPDPCLVYIEIYFLICLFASRILYIVARSRRHGANAI